MKKFESPIGVLPWMMALLLSALAVGCGGGGGGREPILGVPGLAGLAPTVTAIAPLDKSTSVPVNTKIVTATFTKAMDSATLTPTSFTLACPAGTPIAGAVTYLAAGHVAMLTLPATTTLPGNTLCTATVTTEAKDTVGNPLANNFVWTFTTGAATDTTAPAVSSTAPFPNANGVATNTLVTASFSEAMDPLSITTANFTMACPGATAITGTVDYAVNGNTATFTPASKLPAGAACTGTITTGVKDVAGNALASAFVWVFTTGTTSDTTAPTVSSTDPANAATGVSLNKKISATFSEAMDPLTINTSSMTVKQGNTAVSGTVSYVGTTATFNPAGNLAANTSYTATMTTGAKDLTGNALASDFVWAFTTGAATDTAAPTVISTGPANAATAVPVNQEIIATFSEPMDPLTLTNATFTLNLGATPVTGNVTYAGSTATFAPSSPLANDTTYTAAVSNGAKDLAGNALTGGLVPNPWTFRTASALAPAPAGPALVNLDCAANFAILSGSTVTNTGPTIISNGDLGLSPGSAVTGFPPGTISGGVIRINDELANNAKVCLTTAYNDAAGRTTAPIAVSGNIGGQTLAPGLYKSTSTLAISSGDLTLAGPADGVWIFQIASTLTTTAARQIILSGGAQAKNIFWQVGTSATLGTTSDFKGNILADQSITLETGAVLNGRALTRIGAVTLDSNNVTKP